MGAHLQTRIRSGWAIALLALSGLTAPTPAAGSDAVSAPGKGTAPAHGIAMFGDPAYPADFTHFKYANPDAPKGGVMRQAVTGTFDSFHPYIVKGKPASGTGLIYDTLMTSSKDETATQYGLLAESIETPDDRSWVAFTLRQGARWHDGRPIGVEDVIWTFNTLREKGVPMFQFYYAGVERVEKTGERRLKFHFKPGDNRELPWILGQLPVLPKHYWESRSFEETTLEPPLGSGPYQIGSFEAGRYVSYERRADYWGADLPVNRGHYNFDTIRYEYYRDRDVAVEALKGDAYDFHVEFTASKWATAYDVPDVREGRLRKERISHTRHPGMQGFVFNLRRAQFRDRRVREALTYALDFEWLNKNIFYSEYERIRSYFENTEFAARGLPSPAELAVLEPYRGRIPDEVFTTEYQPPKTDGSGKIRANLRRAIDLFAEAGWKISDGKLKNVETGEPMAFELLLHDPSFERIALPFKKSLERIGVDLTVRTVDTSQFRMRLDTYDFDMVGSRFNPVGSPGNEQREFWSSASAKREGSRNLGGVADPAIDELVELVISASDREELIARSHALDRVLQWNFYQIPQWYSSNDRLIYWDRFSRPKTDPSQSFTIETWWFDEAKAARLEAARGGGG
jgi:microcin C transport system substrate-binding protein